MQLATWHLHVRPLKHQDFRQLHPALILYLEQAVSPQEAIIPQALQLPWAPSHCTS